MSSSASVLFHKTFVVGPFWFILAGTRESPTMKRFSFRLDYDTHTEEKLVRIQRPVFRIVVDIHK